MVKKILYRLLLVVMVVTAVAISTGTSEAVKVGYNQNDVTMISGLSEQQIADRLPDRLRFTAHKLYSIENSDRPINALFLISIMRLETGNGTSNKFRYLNNVGGMRGRYGFMEFKSKDESLDYLWNLLNNRYIGRGLRTTRSIGRVYCDSYWVGQINSIAKSLMYNK